MEKAKAVLENMKNKTSEIANALADKAKAESNKLKEKFMNDGMTNGEYITFTSLWEIPEPVNYCRGCERQFATRKHHCRSCGGVFCDDCVPLIVPVSQYEFSLIPSTLNIQMGQQVRICVGCRRGECPSRAIIELCRKRLDSQLENCPAPNVVERLEKMQHKLALKVSEAMGRVSDDGAMNSHLGLFQIKLHRGSFYGENGLVRKAGTSREVASAGYFEIFNKSSSIVAFKLVRSTDNALFELPRPSYISVAPGDAVYAFFDVNNVKSLDLIVLFDNPNAMPSDESESILYDTRAHGAYPERISPCARISEQRKTTVMTINCAGKNVVLKYKGDGVVLPRTGNSIGRVGLFGRMISSRRAPNMLDLNTNVTVADISTQMSMSTIPV